MVYEGKCLTTIVDIFNKLNNNSIPFGTAKELYKKDLQDYKWENKRQKILKRDNYRCIKCGCQHNLQAHHKYYERFPDNYPAKPWDYPDTALITLCDRCHKKEHETQKIKSYYRKFGVHYE